MTTFRLVRTVVALHALWLLLSRPGLPGVFTLPPWDLVSTATLLRYGYGLPLILEYALYALCALALVATVAGLAPRVSALVAAALLYRLAPLEDLFISSAGPYGRGLTADIIALVVIGAAVESERWPVILVRCTVAFQYLFAIIAKLKWSGLVWFSAENMRTTAVLMNEIGRAPYPDPLIHSSALGNAAAIGWLVLSVAVVPASFARRHAWLIMPPMLAAHVLAAWWLGIGYLAAPLLLVFADWPSAAARPAQNWK